MAIPMSPNCAKKGDTMILITSKLEEARKQAKFYAHYIKVFAHENGALWEREKALKNLSFVNGYLHCLMQYDLISNEDMMKINDTMNEIHQMLRRNL